MVATRCKPSNGASVVCMETLERLRSTSSHEEWQLPQGDPSKQLLCWGAEMPEECKHVLGKSGLLGCGFDPHRPQSFSAILHFKNLMIMMNCVHVPTQSYFVAEFF